MGLLVAVFVVSLIRHWPPLTPLMILWINLVTNGLPALALGVDPPDAHLMREPPRNPNEGLLRRRDYLGILYVGGVMGALAVALYAIEIQHDAQRPPSYARHGLLLPRPLPVVPRRKL